MPIWTKRIGLLLASMLFFSVVLSAPVLAKSAQSNTGRGMNRQGDPGTHPGKGWKDPGQDQGSPKNTADPDCTGNRTNQPQPTNKGACDNPWGAPDKPGGSGGFDADKDWNNGCGNDTDFEDDNNGNCGGQKAKKPPEKPHVEKPKPPEKPQVEKPKPNVEKPKPPSPPLVLGGQPPPPAPVRIPTVAAAPPRPAETLPVTGFGMIEMFLSGTSLIAVGRLLTRKQRRR